MNTILPDQPTGDALVAYRVEQAIKAHAQGLVLTRVNGKVPMGKGWQQRARPSLEQLQSWARAGNLGLRTGEISGVVCIDDDTEDQSAAATLGLPTNTPTIITGRGHANRLYKCPSDFVIRNSASKLANRVDVRGEGGMVVYPGSIHPDTSKPYLWAEGLSPDDVPFGELPPDVLDRLRPPPPDLEPGDPADPMPDEPKTPTSSRGLGRRRTRYAEKALQYAVKRVSTAPQHTRNDKLNKEAYGLGKLVGAGWLPEEDVRPALRTAARAAGLPDDEIDKTIESGLTAGKADPVDESILGQPAGGGGHRDTEKRVTILISGGDLPEVVSASERAMLALNREPFFERAGFPMRIVRHATAAKKHGINRPAGALTLVTLEAPYLVESFMHSAVYEVMRKEGPVVIDCPEWVARHYIARRGLWHIPHLEQVIETPIMRRDGTLLTEPGYDPDTELYLDSSGLELPPIPDNPTIEDARRALDVLAEPIKAFPFIEPCDRSAMLAAMLTVLVRPSIRTSPLFAFRAPKMASGKSLLADVVAMIATGRVAPVMTPGKDDEEMRKRLTAFLLAGFPMGCIDNVEQPFGGEAICSVLTQGVWRDRILGKSEMATLPTAVVWTLTGNNVVFVGDITTRIVVCDLDPQVERPEERVFEVDLHTWVPEHRAALVAAGLTILRAYQVAGRPPQPVPVFGRFEEWSRAVRCPLVWLGLADPCAGAARVRDIDPVREQIGRVLTLWHDALGDDVVTVGALIQWAVLPAHDLHDFSRALLDVARGERGLPDPRRLGHWLAKIERRVENGLQLVRMGVRSGATLWAVRRVDGPGGSSVSSVTPSDSGDPARTPPDEAEPPGAVSSVGSVSRSGSSEAATVHGQPVAEPARFGDGALAPDFDGAATRPPAGPANSRNSRNSRRRTWPSPAVAADECSHVTDRGAAP